MLDSSIQGPVALAYTISSLVLGPIVCFLFRHYYLPLDAIQLIFGIALAMSMTQTTAFSIRLDQGWVSFIPSFTNKFPAVGNAVTYLVTAGAALSWSICLVGAILLIYVIVRFERCRKPQVKFQPVFLFFKGFIRWSYAPLVYYSVSSLTTAMNSYLINGSSSYGYSSSTTSFSDYIIEVVTPGVVLAVVFLFPFLQLIAYKCMQQPEPTSKQVWTKWLEFTSYIRLLLGLAMMAIALALNNKSALYVVYVPLVFHMVLFLWKGQFINPIASRILFGLQQSVLICLYSIFAFRNQYIATYDLDLYGLAIIIIIELIDLAIRAYKLGRYGRQGLQQISPNSEDRIDAAPPAPTNSFKSPRNNYKVDEQRKLENSISSMEKINVDKQPSRTKINDDDSYLENLNTGSPKKSPQIGGGRRR